MAGNSLIRWLLGKALRLPPRLAGTISIEPVETPMRDGTLLLADRYFVPGRSGDPCVLIRSPYGRSSLFGMMAALMAERGLQVVAQSVRGTSGSGGTFNPMHQEKDDGADTLDWLHAQPWFAGRLFTFGTSYLGNVQWAMAAARPEALNGLALSMTLSNFRDELRGFGGYTLAGMLAWTSTMRTILASGTMKREMPDFSEAHLALPLSTVDEAAFGEAVPWWREWTAHDDPDDAWWQELDHSAAAADLAAPTSMVAGWQDIFLPHQIADFSARQAKGKPAWLTIGPWTHAAPGGMAESVRDALALFTALRDGKPPHPGRGKVRLFVQQANRWREFESWPPREAAPLRLALRGGGRLDVDPGSVAEEPARYIYDPANPTPSLHGPQVMGGDKRRDMAGLIARDDTVCFTTASLATDCEAIGPVSVDLAVRSDREHTDFFACLCDVDPRGGSTQVADGYIRLRPGQSEAGADGVRRFRITCWPTAWRFRKGHSLRLIVASGAFPRFARNLGTGEPMDRAVAMVPARQEILVGSPEGSFLELSMMPATSPLFKG